MTSLPVQAVGNLQKIRLILLDVDGVLTDGRIGLLPGGKESSSSLFMTDWLFDWP